MDAITRLQMWYLGQCDGSWEHQFGVRIETLDNPGWSVTIDLDGTEYANARFPEFGSKTQIMIGFHAGKSNLDFMAPAIPRSSLRSLSTFSRLYRLKSTSIVADSRSFRMASRKYPLSCKRGNSRDRVADLTRRNDSWNKRAHR
jgi:hypothetical protein